MTLLTGSQMPKISPSATGAKLALLTLAILLTGCAAPRQGSYGGTARSGEYTIKWSDLPAARDQVPAGLTPLKFVFSSTAPQPEGSLSEADWQKEAARTGVSVATLKGLYAGQAYRAPDGSFRACTPEAIKAGKCRQPQALSIDQRVAMAKQILDANAQCKWVGFNPAFNQNLARQLGGEESRLYVQANCQ